MAGTVAEVLRFAVRTRPGPSRIVGFAGAEWQLAAHNATP